MVGREYDCLLNPLGAVGSTFNKAMMTSSDPASFDRKDWGVSDLFRQFLFDNDGLNQVYTETFLGFVILFFCYCVLLTVHIWSFDCLISNFMLYKGLDPKPMGGPGVGQAGHPSRAR